MGTAVQHVQFDPGETTHLGYELVQTAGSQKHGTSAAPAAPERLTGTPQPSGVRGRILSWIVPE